MTFGNVAVRVGEVVEIVYRDDPRSVTKKFTEYNVLVQHRDGALPGAAVTYGHCVVASLFGGADSSTYTLRARSKDTPDGKPGDGSKVLLACVNGDINSAFIFAAVRGGEAGQDPTAEAGHRAASEFNGVRNEIGKDGTLTITVRGATDAAGEPTDSNAGGATLEMAALGDVKVSNGPTSVAIDHSEERIVASASGGVVVDAGGADVVLKAGRVLIGSANASEALVKGTTQRRAEAGLDQEIIGALGSAASAATTLAGTAAALSASMATAAAGLPPPANVALGTAAAAAGAMAGPLGTLAQALGRIAIAFAQYEANAANFLSIKNSTDG
jgi:hypothetical protein